mmetsp:Transcript_32893/g.84047  ORF Transcript_32893/g.84047 Transcript_32893/m.84047 type:complete len:275 (+) Transcript_32893:1385-2209(+)
MPRAAACPLNPCRRPARRSCRPPLRCAWPRAGQRCGLGRSTDRSRWRPRGILRPGHGERGHGAGGRGGGAGSRHLPHGHLQLHHRCLSPALGAAAAAAAAATAAAAVVRRCGWHLKAAGSPSQRAICRHGHGQCLGASAELVGFARDLAGGHAHMLRGGARGPLRHRAPRRCACRWRGSLPGRVSRLMTGGWRLLHRQRQRHRPRHGCLQLRNRRLCVRLGAAMNRPGITLSPQNRLRRPRRHDTRTVSSRECRRNRLAHGLVGPVAEREPRRV